MTTTNDLLAHNLLTAMLGRPATDDDVVAATDDPASFAAMLQCLLPLDTAATTATTETTATAETTETAVTAVTAVTAATTETANGNAGWKPALPGTAVAAATIAEIAPLQTVATPVARDATPQVRSPSASQTVADSVAPEPAVAPVVRTADLKIVRPSAPQMATDNVPPQTTATPAVRDVTPQVRPPFATQTATDNAPPQTTAPPAVRDVTPQVRPPFATQTATDNAPPQVAATQAIVPDRTVAPETLANPAIVARPTLVSEPVQPTVTSQLAGTGASLPATVPQETVAPRQPVARADAALHTEAITTDARSVVLQSPQPGEAVEVVARTQPTRSDGTPQSIREAEVRIPVRPDEQVINQQRVAVTIVRNGPAAPRMPIELEAWLRVASAPPTIDGRASVAASGDQQTQAPAAIGPWAGAVQAIAPNVAQADAPVVIHEVRLPEPATAQLREGEPQRLRVQLDPPRLGECEIELTLREGVVRATMIVERGDTAAALRQVEPQIRQALAERGLELAGFDVGQGPADSSAREAEDAQPAWGRMNPTPDMTDEQIADAAPTRIVGRQHSGRIDLVA